VNVTVTVPAETLDAALQALWVAQGSAATHAEQARTLNLGNADYWDGRETAYAKAHTALVTGIVEAQS
jgi:hypothetical protein